VCRPSPEGSEAFGLIATAVQGSVVWRVVQSTAGGSLVTHSLDDDAVADASSNPFLEGKPSASTA
jgi:hypothetical protein